MGQTIGNYEGLNGYGTAKEMNLGQFPFLKQSFTFRVNVDKLTGKIYIVC